MNKAAIDLRATINGQSITKTAIVRGPNKWEAIVEGMMKHEVKDFTFKLRDGHEFIIGCKICGAINSPKDIQEIEVEDDWELLLLITDESVLKVFGVQSNDASTTCIVFRGKYNTKVRSGDGEFVLYNKPSQTHLAIISRFALKI